MPARRRFDSIASDGEQNTPAIDDRGDSPLRRYNEALNALSRSSQRKVGDVLAAYRELTELGSRTLEVDRVSVWLADDERGVITCQDLYERGPQSHSAGIVLTRREHPAYFAALDTSRVIDAHDARHDPRTFEFRHDYLEPLGITSMLDAPMLVAGARVGVVCFEHCGPKRTWRAEEQAFAASVADFAALVMETSRRMQAEADARLRDEQLGMAIDAARLGVWSYERSSDRVRWSARVAEMFGEPPGAQPGSFEQYLALIHPADRERVRAAAEGALVARRSFTVGHRLSAGKPDRVLESRGSSVIDERGAVVGLTGAVVDVTDRIRLEEQLRHAQKMESVGRLAGGIAHDFNNLLTAIGGHAEHLRLRLPEGSGERSHAELILTAVERATGLTSQLLAFARRRPVEARSVALARVLHQIGALLERLLREDIDFRLQLPPRALAVRVDPNQIEQLVLNLAINAQDAMPRGGTLEVALARDATHAVLTVRDTGSGMDAETAERAFEPFFTTKEVGRGTGLGLSICYGIVHQAGGSIELRSRPGEGTTFEIRLPIASEPPEEVADAGTRAGPESEAEGGHETILLVEDEKLLRDLTAMLLREAGYQVLEAADGSAALALAAAAAHPIDLALCDVVLPGLRGSALLARLREQRPGLRVVFMSGYVDDAGGADEALRDVHILAKPFTPDDLLAEVRAALDAPT